MDVFNKILDSSSFKIVDSKTALNNSDIQNKVNLLACYLLEKKISKNDYVVIIGKNSIDFIILVFALWKIGAIPIPLNYNLNKNVIQNIIEDITPKIILLDYEINVSLPQSNSEFLKYPFKNLPNYNTKELNNNNINAEDTALIIFTSGSSGKPKGVQLSFRNLLVSAKAQNKLLSLTQKDNYLASLPFYHIGGFSILTRILLAGGTLVISQSFKNNFLIEAIKKFNITSISLVTTQFKRMVDENFRPPKYLKNVLIGGSFIENELLSSSLKIGWKPIIVYGSTETCSFVTAKNILLKTEINNSLGKPIGNTTIKIIDKHIAVKGDSLMKGYLNQKIELTNDGYFITEDIGNINENNELVIEGRRDNIIISGGENISLIEIENYVKKIDQVKDTVIIGIKDDEWGEIVAAVVETFDNILFPLEELNNFLSKNIARFKLPKKIFFVDGIPRNEMGKVLRVKLMEMITTKE